jgi:hypothetical protein
MPVWRGTWYASDAIWQIGYDSGAGTLPEWLRVVRGWWFNTQTMSRETLIDTS